MRGMLISDVWNKVEYLEMHEGKLKLKRGHRYYTQITGGDCHVRTGETVFCCCLDT